MSHEQGLSLVLPAAAAGQGAWEEGKRMGADVVPSPTQPLVVVVVVVVAAGMCVLLLSGNSSVVGKG